MLITLNENKMEIIINSSAIKIQKLATTTLVNSILADKFKYYYGTYARRISENDLSITHKHIKRDR